MDPKKRRAITAKLRQLLPQSSGTPHCLRKLVNNGRKKHDEEKSKTLTVTQSQGTPDAPQPNVTLQQILGAKKNLRSIPAKLCGNARRFVDEFNMSICAIKSQLRSVQPPEEKNTMLLTLRNEKKREKKEQKRKQKEEKKRKEKEEKKKQKEDQRKKRESRRKKKEKEKIKVMKKLEHKPSEEDDETDVQESTGESTWSVWYPSTWMPTWFSSK